MNNYFFDIPIYRCPIEKHTQELEKVKNDRLQRVIDIFGQEVKDTDSYEIIENHFHLYQWYPWRFNDIVGWLRLYRLGSQVRGELWFTNAKKIRRDLKRIFFFIEVRHSKDQFALQCHQPKFSIL